MAGPRLPISPPRFKRGFTVDLDGETPIPLPAPLRSELTPVTPREIVRAWSDAQHGIGQNTAVSPWNLKRHIIKLIEIETRRLHYALMRGPTHLLIIEYSPWFIDLRDAAQVEQLRNFALPHPIPKDRRGRVALCHPGHWIS